MLCPTGPRKLSTRSRALQSSFQGTSWFPQMLGADCSHGWLRKEDPSPRPPGSLCGGAQGLQHYTAASLTCNVMICPPPRVPSCGQDRGVAHRRAVSRDSVFVCAEGKYCVCVRQCLGVRTQVKISTARAPVGVPNSSACLRIPWARLANTDLSPETQETPEAVRSSVVENVSCLGQLVPALLPHGKERTPR